MSHQAHTATKEIPDTVKGERMHFPLSFSRWARATTASCPSHSRVYTRKGRCFIDKIHKRSGVRSDGKGREERKGEEKGMRGEETDGKEKRKG